jgi:hypothetical protein
MNIAMNILLILAAQLAAQTASAYSFKIFDKISVRHVADYKKIERTANSVALGVYPYLNDYEYLGKVTANLRRNRLSWQKDVRLGNVVATPAQCGVDGGVHFDGVPQGWVSGWSVQFKNGNTLSAVSSLMDRNDTFPGMLYLRDSKGAFIKGTGVGLSDGICKIGDNLAVVKVFQANSALVDSSLDVLSEFVYEDAAFLPKTNILKTQDGHVLVGSGAKLYLFDLQGNRLAFKKLSFIFSDFGYLENLIDLGNSKYLAIARVTADLPITTSIALFEIRK